MYLLQLPDTQGHLQTIHVQYGGLFCEINIGYDSYLSYPVHADFDVLHQLG